jgi:hypothetical protein
MRLIFALCLALAVVASVARGAVAKPSTSLDVHADRVNYFSNRYVVTADGNVRIRLSDGTVLTGETFAMDLKLNRYLLAGNVHINGSGVAAVGAALSGYPDLDRSYFLPADGDPDRWTYNGLDFANPHKGTEQPGDAFYFPDLTDERPFILASTAFIIPKTGVKFDHSRVHVAGIGAGVYVPTKSYAINFSTNPNFYQNSLAGAVAGFSLPFNGSAHALSEIGFRYDTTSKAHLSFQQHFAWDKDYLVFSLSPLTQEEREYNLIGYKRLSPKVEARVFLQESAAQKGGILQEPEVASAYENVTLNIGLKNSGISINADNYNTSLLPTVEFGLERSFEHPSDATISWSGSGQQFSKYIPVSFRLRGGMGFVHDGYHCGLGAPCPTAADGNVDGGFVLLRFAGTPVPTEWQHFFGFTLSTTPLFLGRTAGSGIGLAAVFDKQRQYFSLPHHLDSTSTTFSATKLYGRRLAFSAIYQVANVGDYYGARQLEFYPPVGPITTQLGTYNGFDAFRGLETNRSWTGTAIFTPNPNFAFNASLSRHYDTPAPIPFSFGQPPLQLAVDTRIRLAKQILMDVSRTYFFNFANQTWTPQLGVTFGP